MTSARPGHPTSRTCTWPARSALPLEEAHALVGLGRCALGTGRTADGEAGLRQALAILQRIGAAEAPDVSAELGALPGAPDPFSASP